MFTGIIEETGSVEGIRKGAHSSVLTIRAREILSGTRRFGGNIVSGHIDGTGTITNIRRDDNAVWYTVCAPDKLMRYIIEKGSIAIDGISLTVASVSKTSFRVSVIPHTASHTTLSGRKPGDIVNLENDCIGKYVERLLAFDQADSRIYREFLGKYGFL